MQEDKPDKPNFNRSAFWEFFYHLIVGIAGIFIVFVLAFATSHTVFATILKWVGVLFMAWAVWFLWVSVLIKEFNEVFPEPRPKLSESFWMRYVVAPVIVGVILGTISYVFTGEFTVGGGSVALIGSIVTIFIGGKT